MDTQTKYAIGISLAVAFSAGVLAGVNFTTRDLEKDDIGKDFIIDSDPVFTPEQDSEPEALD